MHDLDRANEIRLDKVIGDMGGDVEGIQLGGLGKLHSNRRRVIALLGAFGRVNGDFGHLESGQIAGRLSRLNRLLDRLGEFSRDAASR